MPDGQSLDLPNGFIDMTISVNMYNLLRFSNSRFNPQPVGGGGGGNWPTANRSGKIHENNVQHRGSVVTTKRIGRNQG